MKFYTEVPYDHPEYHGQKEQKDISSEEFQELFDSPKVNIFYKVLRFVFFIIFLGPIRFIFTFIALGIFFIFVTVLPKFEFLFKNKRLLKEWAFKMIRPVIRLCMYCYGVVKVNIKGKLEPDTRIVVCNHLTMYDIISVLYCFPLSFVAKDSLRTNKFIQNTVKIFDAVFVDRSKQGGVTEQIVNVASDPSYLPLLIYPEGKITNGEAILGFRSGAFVPEVPVQAVAIRYRMWLTPKGMATVSWLHDSVWEYFYQFYSIPFMTFEAEILPQYYEKTSNLKPAEKAAKVQIQMANALGTLAISQTNKEIFMKVKSE